MSTLEHPTIFRTFAATAAKFPDKTAVAFLGTNYSYGKLLGFAERFAAALAAAGLGKGDRIIMYVPNSIQFVVSWLGIQRLGGVAVPITPIYTSFDLKYVANDTQAKAVICSDRNYGYVKQAMTDTGIKHVVVSNLADLLPFWKRAFGLLADKVPKGRVEKAPFIGFMKQMVSSSAPPAAQPDTREDDIAEILYTGGTTKHPKGVPITNGLFLVSAEEQLGVRDALYPKDKDVILGGAPLFHILGQTCSLSTIVIGGGTLILQPRVNLDAVFDAIGSLKATSLIGVPAFYRMILEHDRVDQYDLSSLKYCFSAGDVLPVEVAKRSHRNMRRHSHESHGPREPASEHGPEDAQQVHHGSGTGWNGSREPGRPG
jgi:long-chain acyl-CoA synthetase